LAQPKYQQIAAELRDQIGRGALPPGERLPSEPDLAARYGASRNTVRLAIAVLTNQGLVESRQGLGTFVHEPARPFTALLSRVKAPPTERHAHAAHPVVSPTTLTGGATPGTPAGDDSQLSRLIVETMPASPSVADKLAVEVGAAVVVRRSQYVIGDVPWQLINSYYPGDVAEGTALQQAGEIPAGSISLLAELGHPQLGFVDEVGTRMPDTREFEFFRLASGTPVLVVSRTSYGARRPIRLTRYIYRGDRVKLLHVEGTIPDIYRDS
jgi:GntR family transcriptional regulator